MKNILIPNRFKMSDESNDSRSSGTSLQIGSAEWREMMYDHQQLDEFQQSDADRERQRKTINDVQYKPQDNDSHQQTDVKPEIVNVEPELNNGRLNTAQRNVSYEIRKQDLIGKALKQAQENAQRTPGKKDDVYVKRELPHILEEQVYDNSQTEDDFYPGSSALRKYM